MKRVIIKIILKIFIVKHIIIFSILKIFSKKVKLEDIQKEKILIIKLWAIGEVVLSTPLVKTIKKNHPGSYIVFLVGNRAREILENNKYINKVIPVDENIFLKFNIIKIMKLIKNLKKMDFDIIINLHHFILFNIFSFFIGAPIRIGFNRNNEGFTNTIKVKPLPNKHKIDEYLSLAKAINIKKIYKTPDIFLTGKELNFANNFIKEKKIHKNDILVGIMPTGSGNPASGKLDIDMQRKVWPIEYYIKLAKILIDKAGVKIIFFGGEREVRFKNKISSSLKKDYINVIEELTLKQLAAVSKQCKFIITNDSGPMHVLWALNVPIFTIFGPTDPKICGPLNDKSIIIKKDLNCMPCFRGDVFPNFAPVCKNVQCIRSIKPNDVFYLIKTKEKYIT